MIKLLTNNMQGFISKIADDQALVISIIEQNFFTNESLQVIGQQLNHIEEIVEKSCCFKT